MIDLHVHTNCSDGELDVISVLKEAEQRGIKYLSITDHDSIMAYNKLKEINTKSYYTGQLIKGVELTFTYNDFVMEALGYGIDIETVNQFKYVQHILNTDIVKMQSERLEIIKKVCDKLNIKYNKELRINGSNCEANDVLLDDIIQYPENKEILDKMGIVNRTTFYRLHYCNSKSPFYVDFKKQLPTIEEVSQAIREAKGKCFIAHIFKYGLNDPLQTIQELLEMNVLDGIECYHKEHSIERAESLKGICKKNNLLISGGSDFHRKTDSMGYYNKYKTEIPDSILAECSILFE